MTGTDPMPNIDPVDIQVMRVVAEDVREIKKQLLGNGSVGLFEQVRRNDDETKRLWKAFDKLAKASDRNRDTGKIFWAKVTAICGGIAMIIEAVARLLQ
jgi:hypothetical protein